MTYFDEGSLLDGAWLAEVSVGSVAVPTGEMAAAAAS